MRAWRFHPSLSLRLAVAIVLAQAILLFTLILVSNFFLGPAINLVSAAATDVVAASVRQGPGGALELKPTPALASLLQANPTLQVAVLDARKNRPVAGSSPRILAALAAAQAARLDPGNLDSESRRSPAGADILVITYADTWVWSEMPRALWIVCKMLAGWMVPIGVVLILLSTLVARRTLRPVRRVVQQAQGVGMRNLAERLTEVKVPGEILPLVRATNSLLDRLDQDFGKQRRFIANAAHELRTPLAVLRARVETIQDGAVREALLSDTDRMVVLVQQMLMMARLRDSQVSLADPIDIGTRVRQLVAHYAPVALAQRREITVDLDGPASCIRGNRQAFDSAVMNILENAVRAEPEDGCVHVIVGPGPVVSVRDHGAGVEEAELALMFEPFWRKDHGTPGSGLGLAIVRESMALHGGAVKASAAPDGGLVVRLQFPHPTAGAEAPATAQDISLPAEL